MEGREALEKLRKLESEGRLDEAIDVNIMTAEDVKDCVDDYVDKFYPPLNKDDKELLYKQILKDKERLFGIVSEALFEVESSFCEYVAEYAVKESEELKEELAMEK